MCGKYGCSKCAGKGWFCNPFSHENEELRIREVERINSEFALKKALKKERELARAQLFHESAKRIFTKYEDVLRRLAAE